MAATVVRCVPAARIFCMIVISGASMVTFTGCNITVGGRRRPLITHGPIEGELDLMVEKRTDEQMTRSIERKRETTEFEERLRLRTSGDLYHPNLLMYEAALGLGLTQFRFKSDIDETESSTGTLTEYSLLGRLLPTKPYPMTFYLNKSDELIPRQFSGSLRSEREDFGATLSVRSEEWPMRFQYSQSDTDQVGRVAGERDIFSVQDERFKFFVGHDFSKFSQLKFDFERNDVTQLRAGIPNYRKEDRYTLRHNWAFGDRKRHKLDSYFNFFDMSGTIDLEQVRWQERMRLRHTDTFETNYSFMYNESRRPTLKIDEIRGSAGFIHKLYESLVTSGNIYTSRSDLGEGVDLTREGADLSFNYRKKNGWGILLANYTVDLLNLEQTGGTAVVPVTNERHPFQVAGSWIIHLDRTNVDTSKIRVLSSDRLIEFSDYTVTVNNGITEIQITPGGDIIAADDQTLSIDYDFFTEPSRDEDALTQTLILRERFNNGLSVYYERRTRDENLTSTETEIVPDEFEVNTFGTDYTDGRLKLLAEYSKEKSTRVPSTGRRLSASYIWPVNDNTRVNVYASNSWIDYTDHEHYDIRFLTLGGSVTSRLTDKYSISSNIDYRDEDDSRQGITRGFQWNTELRYRFRKLTFSTGFEYSTLDRFDYESKNTYLYFRLRRSF